LVGYTSLSRNRLNGLRRDREWEVEGKPPTEWIFPRCTTCSTVCDMPFTEVPVGDCEHKFCASRVSGIGVGQETAYVGMMEAVEMRKVQRTEDVEGAEVAPTSGWRWDG
jgi:hypothetical protein